MDVREFGTVISGNRGRNCEYTAEGRMGIAAFRAAGKTRREVATAVGTNRLATISEISGNTQHRRTGKSAPRKGAPRKLSARAERRLCILAKANPRATYAKLKEEMGTTLSTDTIKRALRREGLQKWRALNRIELTEETAKQRLDFCKRYNTPAKLRELLRTLFTDECTVENSPDNPGSWVIRYSHERYRRDLVNPQEHVKPRISIMVWGMIWLRDGEGGKSTLCFPQPDPDAPRGGVSSQSYKDVLKEGLLPFYEPGDPFMQDNARIHVSGGSPEWLEDHGIWTIDWPTHSPELNPIEHVWKALKALLYKIEPRFHELKRNIADIEWAKEVIKTAWAEIDDNLITTLMKSLEGRIAAVRRAGGWYTWY